MVIVRSHSATFSLVRNYEVGEEYLVSCWTAYQLNLHPLINAYPSAARALPIYTILSNYDMTRSKSRMHFTK